MPDKKRCCRTCRYWDIHSLDMKKGDCRAPGDHRYARFSIPHVDRDGKPRRMVALLDSFGPEETGPNFVCGTWADGSAATA